MDVPVLAGVIGDNLCLLTVSGDLSFYSVSNVAIVFFFMLYALTCSINIDSKWFTFFNSLFKY